MPSNGNDSLFMCEPIRATTGYPEKQSQIDPRDIIGKVAYYKAHDTMYHPVEKLMG